MMQLSDAARAMGGDVRGLDVRFEAVCADSRAVQRGDLFVALRGGRFDGHDYVGHAAQAGAAAAVVERDRAAALQPLLPLAAVADTTQALAILAADWRNRFSIPLIAVAGSNGKTTVKEMIAACLREAFGPEHVLATQGNLNNHIGLPLTLLRLRQAHRCAVIEVGMNHPGETAFLAGIAAPTISLINNAQREHQEFMKSVADVAAEHGTLFAALPDQGTAIINAADEYAGYWRGIAGRRRIRDFGTPSAAIWAATEATADDTRVEVHSPDGVVSFVLPVPGAHNVQNALAAIAAATAAGAALASCARALSAFRAVSGRLQTRPGVAGSTLIDDTYNANPDSVRAAIDVLAHATGRKVLVLGDMGEVGEHGIAFHEEIGDYAKAAGVDRMLALGELSGHAVRRFGAGARHFLRIEELLAELRPELGPAVTVLVKGSRFMRMERVVGAFAAAKGNSAGVHACS